MKQLLTLVLLSGLLAACSSSTQPTIIVPAAEATFSFSKGSVSLLNVQTTSSRKSITITRNGNVDSSFTTNDTGQIVFDLAALRHGFNGPYSTGSILLDTSRDYWQEHHWSGTMTLDTNNSRIKLFILNDTNYTFNGDPHQSSNQASNINLHDLAYTGNAHDSIIIDLRGAAISSVLTSASDHYYHQNVGLSQQGYGEEYTRTSYAVLPQSQLRIVLHR